MLALGIFRGCHATERARRQVFLKARMRIQTRWCDVCIRNISSRGLLIHSDLPMNRGAYIEVRRGRHVIVGRVAWSNDNEFGAQTQDRLQIDAIIAEPDQSGADFGATSKLNPSFERRAVARTASLSPHSRDRARHFARATEFASTLALGVLLVACAGMVVVQTLGAPLSRVTSTLGQPGETH